MLIFLYLTNAVENKGKMVTCCQLSQSLTMTWHFLQTVWPFVLAMYIHSSTIVIYAHSEISQDSCALDVPTQVQHNKYKTPSGLVNSLVVLRNAYKVCFSHLNSAGILYKNKVLKLVKLVMNFFNENFFADSDPLVIEKKRLIFLLTFIFISK